MKVTQITQCRICGNKNLIPLFNLGEQALSGRFPKLNERDPPTAPLELVMCDPTSGKGACGLVQLRHSVTQDELYKSGYGYLSSMNDSMKKHLRDIAILLPAMVNLKPRDIILDIGSNDGTLLKQYPVPQNIERVGIDAGGKQYTKYYPDNIKLISDYFSADKFKSIYGERKAKIITSIAMFYDLEKPLDFILDIKEILHPDGVWVLEQSYYPEMVAINSFDTICHEHLEYYSLQQIYWMANKLGMRIVDVELNKTNGGSFRVYICHREAQFISNTRKIIIILNKEMAGKPDEEFKLRVDEIKRQVVTFIKKQKSEGKTIYVYGASTKGNVLLQYFGLNNTLITGAADKNPDKWGCKTPATHIPIMSEEDVRKLKPDYMLVLPWHFRDEFLVRETEYLKNGGKFIFPLPKFEVVG